MNRWFHDKTDLVFEALWITDIGRKGGVLCGQALHYSVKLFIQSSQSVKLEALNFSLAPPLSYDVWPDDMSKIFITSLPHPQSL